VAVRIGFDDNRALGEKETGSRAALPIFREIMLRLYQDQVVGPLPRFPRDIETRIDEYLAMQAAQEAGRDERRPAFAGRLSLQPASVSGERRRAAVTSTK
jgi:membrane carboxypeptidase/penicillin-binding protein